MGAFTSGFGLFKQGEDETTRIIVPLGNDPLIGNANSSVLIIAFSEYECPFCTKAEQTIKSIRETYKDEVVYNIYI